MTLYELLEQEEIDTIIDALIKEQNRCMAIFNRPLQGERVGEKEKKQQWRDKADEIQDLLGKIIYLTI